MIDPTVCSTHGSGTVDVHLIPTHRDDEVDHMPVSGTRMHPGGLAFILLLEHVVQFTMSRIIVSFKYLGDLQNYTFLESLEPTGPEK